MCCESGMTTPSMPCRAIPAAGLLAAIALSACSGSRDDPSLSKGSRPAIDLASIPIPPADGPKLGSIAPSTVIAERPAPDARVIGYLSAGATVARSPQPIATEGCSGGWYAVRPRGFVCLGETATIAMNHPALTASRLAPRMDSVLPYTYVRTLVPSRVLAPDRSRVGTLAEAAKLRRGSALAVVGAVEATMPEGGTKRVQLLPDGRSVPADDIKPIDIPEFKGVEINDDVHLPVAFVVKYGVRNWHIEADKAAKRELLQPMTAIHLTGKFRSVSGDMFWATADGRHVRHKDMTVVRKRDSHPEFAIGDQKWIDISITTSTLVAYEGKRPVYATLISPGRDRFGDPRANASTQMGTFSIAAKHVTASKVGTKPFSEEGDMLDVPWVLELSSGEVMHSAFWHARFGVERSSGNVELPPVDAAWLFRWVDPALPEGWHGVSVVGEGDKRTIVLVRK